MNCNNIKCGVEHDGSYGGGRFCSRACANSRNRDDAVRDKISKSVKLAYADGRGKRPVMSEGKIAEIMEKRKKNKELEILNADFDKLLFGRIRKRILIEQGYKCNRCGISEWLGESISLEIEHKDGDNANNVRDNLECLCPNCHSLTTTWRGRNKRKSGKKCVTDDEIIVAYLETGNIRQCLLKLGIAAKGSNYGRVKRALTLNGIEY